MMTETHESERFAEPGVPENLAGAVEALLLMAEEPMAAATLAEATQAPVEQVIEVLSELAVFYDRTGRGFELRHVGGGWRYYTRAEHAELINRWVLDGQQSKLSQAALETLAVVAYLQPISRTRVAAVRGVSVDGVMRTLNARGLIAEAGHDEETGAMLFRTSELFCEKLGINSLSELPALAPYLPEAAELEAELSSLVETPTLEAAATEPAEPTVQSATPEEKQ
ncbi:SMC-Scp complex subunit ScpB [Naumannella sp. ID2617S]|nr:SMC-Scp complex subunit ScpB [Naumannella sp. ID2617S]